jgi:hypothetical protein
MPKFLNSKDMVLSLVNMENKKEELSLKEETAPRYLSCYLLLYLCISFHRYA